MLQKNPKVVNHRPARHTPIYVNGKVIGQVVGNTFIKHIAFSKHTLRSPRAIAFDVSTLDDAERAGATIAEIHDVETRDAWTAPISLIRSNGFPVRRGFGNQWALTLNYWSRNDAPSEAERQEAAEDARLERQAMKQLDLFVGVQ